VQDGKISEIETVSADSDGRRLPHDVIPLERRSAREDLIALANGYFEAVGMLDPGAAKLGPNCLLHEAGRTASCATRLANRTGQQTIERRFPVVVPELGVVVGYTFVMHHERTPPQDELIVAVFRIEDSSILEIDAAVRAVPAPGRSGFAGDFPDPGIIRGAPPTPLPIVQPTPEPWHFPGYWRVRNWLDHGTFSTPETVSVPKPPYPGITDVRDIAYGADPMQRLDILAPSARTDKPRTVLVFVHGGAWESGKRRIDGDTLYENVVLWAAQHGMVGVNIDYRLADYQASRNLYPTQEQDVAAAMDWIGDNIANYGGDPNRIFMWGHSAGGSTIAGYASNPMIYGLTPGVKGIFLLSSPLDPTVEERNGQPIRYFGRTHAEFAAHAPLKTLTKCDVPVLFGYSPQEKELPPELEQERRVLCEAGHCPRIVFTKGSHSEEIRAVGTTDRSATDALLAFIASIP
jgi:triacylglycerol lipase